MWSTGSEKRNFMQILYIWGISAHNTYYKYGLMGTGLACTVHLQLNYAHKLLS